MVERQTVAPSVAVHGPSPFAKPHSLSLVSQTPLVHTSIPAAALHVPSSVGLLCGASDGNALALGSVGRQAFMLTSHHLPMGQSASTLQPPMGSQKPLLLQTVERQTVPPVAPVHGPSPTA